MCYQVNQAAAVLIHGAGNSILRTTCIVTKKLDDTHYIVRVPSKSNIAKQFGMTFVTESNVTLFRSHRVAETVRNLLVRNHVTLDTANVSFVELPLQNPYYHASGTIFCLTHKSDSLSAEEKADIFSNVLSATHRDVVKDLDAELEKRAKQFLPSSLKDRVIGVKYLNGYVPTRESN